jgi:RES domain-containing protein
MIVFRLTKKKFAESLSGEGAKRVGGRWNSIGTPMLYTSQSRALALLELAVHVPFIIQPEDYRLVSIEIPSFIKVKQLDPSKLPTDWNTFAFLDKTQQIGDELIRNNEILGLRVPSAIVPGDSNIIINPLHSSIKHVKIIKVENFAFDGRLFRSV